MKYFYAPNQTPLKGVCYFAFELTPFLFSETHTLPKISPFRNLSEGIRILALGFVCFCFLPSASAQGKEIYILNRGGHNILTTPLDTIDLTEKYSQDLLATSDFVFDAASSKLFWVGNSGHQILFGQTDGEFAGTPIATDVATPVDLEIDPYQQKIYWADYDRKRVYRSNFDGSLQEAVSTDSVSNLSGIALLPNEDLLFYADIDSGVIWSSALNGENPKIFVQSLGGSPVRLLIDTVQRKLYWSDDEQHRIERINLDGTEQEVFYQGNEQEHPFGLFLDQFNALLYWTDYGTDMVLKSGLSGLNVAEFITKGLADPIALTIVPMNGERPNNRATIDHRSLENSAVSVYPNPADNLLTFVSLNGTQNIEQVWIFDGVGKQVFSNTIHEYRTQIDTRILAEGFYSYAVVIAGQVLTGHFSIIR